MKRMTELLELYLETEDREKLKENSYQVFSNRMKSIRDSSLSVEEFVQLSELYNELYRAEHEFIQFLATNKTIEDLKNDFKFNETEIGDLYKKHSKELYDQEVNKKVQENKTKSSAKKPTEDIKNQNHKCSCGGNCGTKTKTEKKSANKTSKPKTLDEILKEFSENAKKINNEGKVNSNEEFDRVFENIFKTLNNPRLHENKQKFEDFVEDIIEELFRKRY